MAEILEQLRARTRRRSLVLCEFADGPETRAALLAVRRRGPGRLRRYALDALMYLGGESALAAPDRAAVERLIRIRRRTDRLGSVTSCWTHWWCVRSEDQMAVVAGLGLTAPRPATYDLACSVIEVIEHDDRGSGLVYVGPSTNGWVPVVGPWCDVFGKEPAAARARVERLSAEFGEVHAFYFGAQGDGSGWLVARDGATVRRYNGIEDDDSTGELLPLEAQWMAEHGIPGPPERYHSWDDDYPDDLYEYPPANEVAAAISLDVGWYRPRDAVTRGYPLLAMVPGGNPRELPPGMYDI